MTRRNIFLVSDMNLRPSDTAISDQSRAFREGEADLYFERNCAKYSGAEPHATLDALELALNVIELALDWTGQASEQRPRRALEVGCANGLALNQICARLRCEGEGIDPSDKAIRDGQVRFPSLNLQVGTAEQLPFEDGRFDFVLLGFFLYLVPDHHYLMALAQAHRVLRAGGFLMLVDFDHPSTNRRAYMQRQDLFSYRHRACDVLAATRMYALAGKWPVGKFSLNPLDRVSLSLMYREKEAYPLIDAA